MTSGVTIPHTQQPTSRVVRSSRKLAVRTSALTVAVLAVFGVLAPAAQAQSVPRFLPTKVPAGYQITDFLDRSTPSSIINYLQYFRTPDNQRAILISAVPAQKEDFTASVSNLVSIGAKKTKVRGLTATVIVDDGYIQYNWWEKNRLFRAYSIQVPQKTLLATITSIGVSGLPDASYSVKKKPAGFQAIYAGTSTRLYGAYSGVLWESTDGEIELSVTSIDPRYVEIYLNTPFETNQPTTVNGKPAFVIESSSSVEVWWQEQPGLLIELEADDLSTAALLEVAASIAPVDEATWTKAVNTPPVDTGGNGGGGASGGGTSGALVGAGMVDTAPWTANAGATANCLLFTVAGASTEACVKGQNSLGWNSITVAGKTYAFGVGAANVATVVATVNGAEVGRAAVTPASGQPLIRVFALALPANVTGATITGLDAAGGQVQAALAAGA
jgi:hypothetical protein